MKFFFSCDWGTSTFRLRLIKAEELIVLTEIKTAYGIASAFEEWKQMNGNEKDRISFYQAYLFNQVEKITHASDNLPDNIPIILSGMASSSIGMKELPYKELPFQCNGSDLVIDILHEKKDQPHRIVIISGVKSATDVLRGEETMLTGCNVPNDDTPQLFIFPGTHSKHIMVKNGSAQNITTYMTGELFDLLSKKSILSQSVKKNDIEGHINTQSFIDGINKGASSNILNSIFSVRTNRLFNKITLAENFDYLSGLLIGCELGNALQDRPGIITLVCSKELKNPYMQALAIIAPGRHCKYKDAGDALIRGQWNIMQQHGLSG